MKKNQAQKFIVLFLFFHFAYSWRVEAQTGKEKQITMEFKNEGLPSIFKRFEKVSGYKVLFIYDEISSYTSTGKVEKATVDEALKVIILKSATKLFSVLLASKRPLITELADKLRLKYPLLPTISPCPTMRLEAIRSIIPISCRRYPKSV